jgi:hypothetical protein
VEGFFMPLLSQRFGLTASHPVETLVPEIFDVDDIETRTM